ncbi:MAG: adenosylcobinamide-phosphate synthase [Anaerocolumna sp.]|nr:adenosylcobinamide-phosphate synthase [Anaerocolumna sp.]
MILHSMVALLFGFVLDLIFGDPHWLPHPIRFIGKLISKTEKVIRKDPKLNNNNKRNANLEIIKGVILVVIVLFISTLIPFFILYFLYKYIPWLGLLIESIMCYQILATKCLKVESMRVYQSLKKGDLEEARYYVSMIVGRDTKILDETGITKAAVETVAENTSDGVIAPMIYMALGGATLGFFYKAVNTMDSMVGYKNEKYLYFGRFAAKLDDVMNYLPARISAFIMILVCPVIGLDIKSAARIYKRDRRNHASPNSAQTEAVCAGALNIELAGDAYYFGVLHKKPTIGDAIRPIETNDIKRANILLYATAFATMLIILVIKILIGFVCQKPI